MAHKSHEQFSEGVFTSLCDQALQDFPSDARDEEVALEHLLSKVRGFCGVEIVKIRDYIAVPRCTQLRQQIIDVVEHDSIVEHTTSSFFHKEPIINEYVHRATDQVTE